MKSCLLFTIALAFAVSIQTTQSALNVPGATGADGAFAPTTNTVVDLSQAPAAAWDSAPPTPGRGVYDVQKWAVVFKYSSVNIPEGVTVTFKNNASRAPVVWLASGDVTISGVLDVSGRNGGNPTITEPGPGGFRGGKGSYLPLHGSAGFGPGGSYLRNFSVGASHAFKVAEAAGGPAYGDLSLVQLIGGSGGGGYEDSNALGQNQEFHSGGGGGGAVLIAATSRIILDGRISANGGTAATGYGSGGSGGAIRILADVIAGSGSLEARGAGPGTISSRGFIRLEANGAEGTISTEPVTQVIQLNANESIRLWPPDSAGTARVISVGGVPVPADPKASVNFIPADVRLPLGGNRDVLIETTQLPVNAVVTVFVIPVSGQRSEVVATHVSGDIARSTWNAKLDAPPGHSVIQVRAVSP